MKIEELVDRYFEGETSCEEERELRRFFNNESVPEHLEAYRPLFAYIEQEVKAYREESNHTAKTTSRFRRINYIISGVAAVVLLLIGIAGINKYLHDTPENYVIIDGKQYTDDNIVREQALAAFRDIRTTEDEVLDLMFE